MLVLTRGRGQIIKIGDDIQVMVVRVKGGSVRIGITAPPDLRILRPEMIAAITHDGGPDRADGAPSDGTLID